MNNKKKVNLLVLVLVVLLAIAIIYIGVDQYKKYRTKQETKIYQEAVKNLVSSMYESASSCNTITLSVDENKSAELVSVACLNQGQQQQAQQQMQG